MRCDTSRRIPGARTERVKLSGEAAEALRPGLEDLARQAEELGMPADAAFGAILEAAGQDISGEQALLESAEAMAQVSPAAAHAFVATDGLILTEEDQHLVDPVDARRWAEAAGAHEVVFGRLDQLELLDRDTRPTKQRSWTQRSTLPARCSTSSCHCSTMGRSVVLRHG